MTRVSFPKWIQAASTATMIAALASCGTGDPSNSPTTKKNRLVKARSDAGMQPASVVEGCQRLKSGGSYVAHEGAGKKVVSFFLERDAGTGSIRKVGEVLESGQFVLESKSPHASKEPGDEESSLWMELVQKNASSLSLRVIGKDYVTSDGETDWHWTGAGPDLYYRIVEALGPQGEEQHEDKMEDATPLPVPPLPAEVRLDPGGGEG
jgi:hypothetical protein